MVNLIYNQVLIGAVFDDQNESDTAVEYFAHFIIAHIPAFLNGFEDSRNRRKIPLGNEMIGYHPSRIGLKSTTGDVGHSMNLVALNIIDDSRIDYSGAHDIFSQSIIVPVALVEDFTN